MNNGVISHFCSRYNEHDINSNMGSLCFNKWCCRGLKLFWKEKKVEGGNYNDELCSGASLRGVKWGWMSQHWVLVSSRSEFTTASNVRDRITQKLFIHNRTTRLLCYSTQKWKQGHVSKHHPVGFSCGVYPWVCCTSELFGSVDWLKWTTTTWFLSTSFSEIQTCEFSFPLGNPKRWCIHHSQQMYRTYKPK
jgi:hypothetical protein